MEEEIIKEFESTEDDELFRVIRSFQLPVRKGPPVPVQAGSIVRLKYSTARELVPVKVFPLWLVERPAAHYEAVQKFQTVDADGLWVEINPGDRLELTLEEALPMMALFQIKPIKEESKNEVSRT